jgi:hypothetical protein
VLAFEREQAEKHPQNLIRIIPAKGECQFVLLCRTISILVDMMLGLALFV